jgi:adenosylmethionine-8-amino-7-oxononanoate aminotransferase
MALAETRDTASMRGVGNVLLHFTANDEDWSSFPVIVRAHGTRYVTDTGRELFDGLAGLYTTQVGHGREELAEAAAQQMRTLDFVPSWSLHHPRSLELAARLSELAPVDGPASTMFVSSGSEAVETMIKLVRQFHAANGQPERATFITRDAAYHGVTLGALALGGLPGIRDPFLPLGPDVVHVPNTREDAEASLRAIEAAVEARPDRIAAIVLEPVQNSGGCLVPPGDYWPRLRELCDRHGILLVADCTICAFGRVGSWFGVEQLGGRPDILTYAKGLTSGYVPMGGVTVSAKVRESLDTLDMVLHGATFGGHPVAAAVALANLDILEREGLVERSAAMGSAFGQLLRDVQAERRIVTDVRGTAMFWALELDTAWADGRPLSPEEHARLFKDGLFRRLLELGLMCRVDDRDSPVLQFAPALTTTEDELRRLASAVSSAVAHLEAELGYDDGRGRHEH